MIDIWTSRRDCFLECYWWSQIDDSEMVDINALVYSKAPTGKFYARESSSYTEGSQVVANSFLVENLSINLETRDNISEMKRNDIVKLNDVIYRVDTIQKAYIKKQRQFINNKNSSAIYYISLRG